MSKNFNTTEKIMIPADGSPVAQDLTFSYLMIRTARFDFEMSFDGQYWFPMAQGEAIGPFNPPETKVWFRSLDNQAVEVEFRASSVANSNNRLNLIKDVQQNWIWTKDGPTIPIGDSTALAAGASSEITGGWEGLQRRSLKVYNLSDTDSITVQDENGNTCGAIPPLGKDEFLTSGTLVFKNENAAPVTIAWLETYYAN